MADENLPSPAGETPEAESATTPEVVTPTEPDAPKQSFIKEVFAPIAGFGVTFRTMLTKPVTEEYPEDKRPTAPRYHGRHVLNRHADGLEKCVGCELCAWACPADAIYVEGADNTDEERYSPGENRSSSVLSAPST